MSDKERLHTQLLEVYREFYRHELDRKEKLSGRFPMLLAIYTLLIGIITFYLNNLPMNDGGVLVKVFYLFLVAQGVAILYSFWYAVIFLHRDTMLSAYVRTADGINDYVRGLEAFNRKVKPVARVDICADLREFLIEQYSTTSTRNFRENKDRQAIFGMALGLLIVAASLALLSAIPYFVLKANNGEPVHKVKSISR